MMGFFSNLFAKQNCAVCGKECGTMHRSKLRDGQFLCDDCGDQCSKYIRLSELTLDEAKEHMAYMARMKRVFDEVFNKTELRVNAYPSTPSQMATAVQAVRLTACPGCTGGHSRTDRYSFCPVRFCSVPFFRIAYPSGASVA